MSKVISIGIPLFNESETLSHLLARLVAVLEAIRAYDFEIILVDDGSTDQTPAMAKQHAAQDSRIRYVRLSRNFGHQAALSAALDHVSGDVVVLMDGDLQDAPEVIPLFLSGYEDGHDVVYAVRRSRPEGLLKRACYAGFYRLANAISEIPLPLQSGDFCLLSRRVVEHLRSVSERGRYLRGLRTWVGFSQVAIQVDRDERFAGSSKYSLRKLARLALDGLFSFSVVPIRIAWLVGLGAAMLSAFYALYAMVSKLLVGQPPEGFTGTIVTMVFLAGIQLFFLGVIGEYIGRIYVEVKQRPIYLVDQLQSRNLQV